MNIAVRTMQPGDVDAVAAIEAISFSMPWSRESFAQELEENDLAHYLVVEADGKVVGYAGMWIILDEAHVTNIAMLPEYRGLGLGEKLVSTLMEQARSLGAVCMTLEVRKSNAGAQRFYGRLGFIPRGLRRQYYTDTQEDAIIMWKDAL